MSEKYALLIGITYPNSNANLPGCDNDIYDIYNFLKTRGYDEFDILCDSNKFDSVEGVDVHKPIATTIVRSLFKLLSWAKKNPTGQVFVHYSGHGTQIADTNWHFDTVRKLWSTEETDGKDECMVTQDLKFITDDQLKWVFSQLPKTITLFSLMDSCHSGSAFDLKYYLKNPSETTTTTSQQEIGAEVIMISGCADEQYSQSYMFNNSKWYGVMSYAFLYLMNYMNAYNIREITLGTLWNNMNIICSNFPQLPQASCSKNDFSSLKLICTKDTFELQKITPVIETEPVNTTTTTRSRNTTTSKTRNRSRWKM